jgi:TIR domain
MQIFLSYASEDRDLAEEIQLALLGAGHSVFFDKASLPAGGDFHSQIERAVQHSDIFVFLISPHSVAKGSYALTELKFARIKWHHPKNKVLPVRLHGTPWEAIPPYLKSITVLEPEGSAPAEVVAAIGFLPASAAIAESTSHVSVSEGRDEILGDARRKRKTPISHRTEIWIAVIGLVGALGTALIANWTTIFGSNPIRAVSDQKPEIPVRPESGGMKGSDAQLGNSPTLNTDCPEITEWDYSKFPPESRIVRRCNP